MPAENSSVSGFFISRQPVFTRDMTVFGYELLYCPHPTTPPLLTLDDAVVMQALVDALGNIGLPRLVGDKKAFLPVNRSLLFRLPSSVLPPDRLILELTRDTPLDAEMIERLAGLLKMGYLLAQGYVTVVNDWVAYLSALTQIYRTPIHGRDPIVLADTITRLHMTRAKLLADTIETPDDQTFCQRYGFDFYQGSFYHVPKRTAARRVDTSRMSVMRTLAMIQDPRSDFYSLGRIISQDGMLSQKLLGMVNSLAFSLPRSVSSIEQAVAYMGLNQLRGWMTLLTLASIPGKPPELTNLAILRAKMSELLAPALGSRQADVLFTTGLFSVLDALLDLPIEQAIANIPLPEEVVTGLTTRGGLAGVALHTVLAYERGDWNTVLRSGIKPDILSTAYMHALHWATEIATSVGSG